MTSAIDNVITIRGGANVNVSTVSNEPDGQQITLYVCSSSGATSSGCSGTQYCTSTGSANVSCTFASESDSATHNWYAYIYDSLNEAASSNPLTGSYTTDSTAPIITLSNPLNNSNITQNSITFSIVVNEGLTNAWYSLDAGVSNVTMSNTSLYLYTHLNTSIADGSYNLSIWANDSYGNIASLTGNSLTIDTSVPDTTKPEITIWSPANGSYLTSADVILNITSDENLSLAEYTLDGGSLTSLDNTSVINWNASISGLSEGTRTIVVYANDSSSNRNQGNKTTTFYVDLNNPSVVSFDCLNGVDSEAINCSISVSDGVGLSSAIIAHNATGTWQNSSSISLSGSSQQFNFTIGAGNTTPGVFRTELYVYDISSRLNDSSFDLVSITDDTYPTLWNITYSPSSNASLDPGVEVSFNVTIVEDYSFGDILLMYRNSSVSSWSSINMSNLSAIGTNIGVIYNASIVLPNETWYLRVNASDSSGNMNISESYILDVQNDTSYWNSTEIFDIESFTYAQRTENNSLGNIFINNSGDMQINFTISVSSSSLTSRFNINWTSNESVIYSIEPLNNISIPILVNTSHLTSGLYNYTITINSGSETTSLSKRINIQTADGPYLSVSIPVYSASVTKGQTGIELQSIVQNLGTQDASNVLLVWSLPSEFSVSSGNISRSASSLPIGGSLTNTISISVSSGSEDKYVNISAIDSASSINSTNISKSITIGSPVVSLPPSGAGGNAAAGYGSGGGGAQSVSYSNEIEVVRGKTNEFEIPIRNGYYGTTLRNLTLSLSGFLDQYVSINPKRIDSIGYNQTEIFTVRLLAPSYKDYEVHDLTARIKGTLISANQSNEYSETQYIKLVIQEVSREDANSSLEDAKKAIQEMKDYNFSIGDVDKLLLEAENWLVKEKRYKNSLDISNKIIEIRNTAFEADDLLRRVIESMQDPKKSSLLVGNVVAEFVSYDKSQPLDSLITGRAIFASSSIENVVELGIAAFERGDYGSALDRAREARNLLVLERKGNFLLFMYLYWHYVLFAIVLVSGAGILGYSRYQKANISGRITDLNRKEDSVRNLITDAQKKYFAGKISNGEYHSMLAQNQNEISKIKSLRLKLGNTRIKMLKPQEVESDLEKERKEVESGVMKIQEKFYRDQKMPEKEYRSEFDAMNERLAEIEEEKTTLKLMEKKEIKAPTKHVPVKAKGPGFFSKVKKFFERGTVKEEQMFKEKIAKMLGEKK